MNTVNVTASCMVLSWTRLYGPPVSCDPARLAGTWNTYSKNASPQLMRMIENSPKFLPQENSLNLRCPYQAKVMKVLEMNRKRMVFNPRIGFAFYSNI